MLVQSIGKMTWILTGSFNHVNNSQYGFDTEAYVIIRFPRTFLLSIHYILLFTCRDLFYINIQGWLASDYSPGKNVSLTYLRLLICKNLLHAYHYHRHSCSISKMFSVCNSFLPVFSVYPSNYRPPYTHTLLTCELPSFRCKHTSRNEHILLTILQNFSLPQQTRKSDPTAWPSLHTSLPSP